MTSPKKHKYKHIIFDFDGTIADTLQLCYELMERMSKQHKFHFPKQSMEQLRDFDVDAFVDLLEISRLHFYRLLFKGKKLFGQRIKEIQFCNGMEQLLYYLKGKYPLSICTSNSEKNVQDFLAYKKINFFNAVISGWNISGKKTKLKKFLKKQQLHSSEVLYIGDEARDILACQVNEIDVVAATWGYNSKQKLAAHNPTYLIDNPKDLQKIL